jgi:hypothetical protein
MQPVGIKQLHWLLGSTRFEATSTGLQPEQQLPGSVLWVCLGDTGGM